MAKNKKPAKKYTPRFVPTVPMHFRFGPDSELKLKLIPHQYLEKFRDGTALEPDWHALAARLNLGNTLAYTHFEGQEEKTAMDEALLALRSVWDRHTRLGKWGTSGEEFGQIGLGLTLTDEMQDNCTRIELDQSMKHVYRNAAVDRRPR
jgi:hypothetical protein